MSNIKISALPTTGVSTLDDYLVIDDAALTTTSKIQVKNVSSLTRGSGTNSVKPNNALLSGASANNSGSIALGENANSSHDNAVVLGKNVSSQHSDTTHAQNLTVNGQVNGGFIKFAGSGFLNWVCSLGNVQEIEIDGNTNFGFANIRTGAMYDFIITSNGGPFTVATWNAPAGYTLKWQGGIIPQPTANASDVYHFAVSNNTIWGYRISGLT